MNGNLVFRALATLTNQKGVPVPYSHDLFESAGCGSTTPMCSSSVSTSSPSRMCELCSEKESVCCCALPLELCEVIYAPIIYGAHEGEPSKSGTTMSGQAAVPPSKEKKEELWASVFHNRNHETNRRRRRQVALGHAHAVGDGEVLVRPVVFDPTREDIYYFALVSPRGYVRTLIVSDFRHSEVRHTVCNTANEKFVALSNAVGQWVPMMTT